MYFLHTDIISSLKSGDSPTGSGNSVDTSLSPNDLTNSTSSVVPVDRRLRDEEPKIFSKLPSGQFGSKGKLDSKYVTLLITSIRIRYYVFNPQCMYMSEMEVDASMNTIHVKYVIQPTSI